PLHRSRLHSFPTRRSSDLIIIGSGAGGGTLAHRLAPTGLRVLILERGGYLPREPENWDSREVFGKERYVTDEMWYDKYGVPFRPDRKSTRLNSSHVATSYS